MQNKEGDFIVYTIKDNNDCRYYQFILKHKITAQILCNYLNKIQDIKIFKTHKYLMQIGIPEYNDRKILKLVTKEN